MDKPILTSFTAHFVQDSNTFDGGDGEDLEIRCETQLFDEPPFFIIKTEGWSFDSASELEELVDRCRAVFMAKKEEK